MNDVWVRLYKGWSPDTVDGDCVGWALWQPGYQGNPWPYEEMRPGFTYYVCDELQGGGRAIVARATVKHVLPLTPADSSEEAHRLVAGRLFDDEFTIGYDDWQAHTYNQGKATARWPQRITAWRISTEPIGPYVLPGLHRFPRTAWLTTDKIALSP